MQEYYIKISEILKSKTAKPAGLYDAIVNVPFQTLLPASFDIGTIVLLVVNEDTHSIDRVGLSDTPAAKGAVNASSKPFKEIKIPLSETESAHVKALQTGKEVYVTDWYDMFRPALSSQQARDNQHGAGIITSVVVPFFGEHRNGTLIFSYYVDAHLITEDAKKFMDWFSKEVATLL